MSQLHKSTPKMRKVYTPRVKSAQIIDNVGPKKNLFFSNNKNDQNDYINPQKVQQHLSKKLNVNNKVQHNINKIDIQLANNVSANSPARVNNFLKNNQPARNNPAVNQKEQKDQSLGRNLQWPNNQRGKFNGPNLVLEKQNSPPMKQRCQSAHSSKANNSVLSLTQKASRIKQQKHQFEEKVSVAMDYLIRSNSAYLNERKSMCNQRARPRQQIFKINRPPQNTTNKDMYQQIYDKHRLDIEPQNEKMSILMSESKICGNSTTQQFHSGREGKKAELATWGAGFKLQGPLYGVTTNINAFPNHGNFDKMVPIAVWNQHPLGMKHKQTSSNSKFLKGQFCQRSDLATWNNLNPIANDLFHPQKQSYYDKQFGKKQKQPIQQWPLPDHKLIVTDGKFTTEMKTNMEDFNKHQLNLQNRCQCKRKRH